jgi:hypothetical protein
MTEINRIYICIFERLSNSADREGIIKRKKLCETIGKFYHVKKSDVKIIIDELKEFGLIEVLDKFKVKVNKELPIQK